MHLGMSSLAQHAASSRFALLGVSLLGLQPLVLSIGAVGEMFGKVPAGLRGSSHSCDGPWHP